ncbi:hypothetical protein MKX01_041598 [Papaver californicum]|nr:hypothetical protein MKX01_041598 [Papaver californicum]
MLKFICFALLCCPFSLGLTHAGQESFTILKLHDPKPMISSSVLIAESWLRTHVLTHHPATKINLGLVLPCMKNIYHSLVRWGLEKQIEVSAGVSKACLHPHFNSYKDDISDSLIKPVLDFLYYSNSTYSSHRVSMKKSGFLNAIDMNVVIYGPEEKKPIKRKLSSVSTRPTSMPTRSSIGYSVPAYVTKNPPSPSMYPPSPVVTPALPLVAPPPTPSIATYPVSYSYPPPSPPVSYSYPHSVSSPPLPLVIPGPANLPPDSFTYPPCVHSPPADTAPTTSPPPPGCYDPDTVFAHASYAFNSHWQKNKNNGGTCSFGGTAMIINTYPSFLQCRFLLMD